MKQSRGSFLGELLRHLPDRDAARDEVINVLLAGRDTTAACLSWTIRLLLRHPRVWCQLLEELTRAEISNCRPGRKHLQRFTYLHHVIRESLRLYPPIPLNSRTAVKTTFLPRGGGIDGESAVLIRRGDVVVYSSSVSGRRCDVWGPDANEFRPERWNGLNMNDGLWSTFPFSGGLGKTITVN